MDALTRDYVPNSISQNLFNNLSCCDWACLLSTAKTRLKGGSAKQGQTSLHLGMHAR